MGKIILIMLLSTAGAASATPLACIIEPEKTAEIGAPNIGIIDKIAVERGDYVKAGQVLAHMNADVERASLGVASVKAQADADLKAAIAAQELAKAKALRARSLVDVGFISKEALDQAEAEANIARNRVTQAEEARRVARQELSLSHSQLAQRSIRSPFEGVVIDRYRTEGERIEREPIVRLAKVDPLRVEVLLPSAQFGQIEKGMRASVKTDIANGDNLAATVVLVDPIVDAASNTFRVRLALPNPGHKIPAGLRCSVDFGMAAANSRNQGPASKAGSLSTNEIVPAVMRTDFKGRLSYELQRPPQSN